MAMFNKWPKGNIPKPSILHSSVCTRSWHHKLSTNIHHAPDLCGLPQTVPRSTKEAVNLAAGDGERWFGQWDLFIWRNHRELSTHIFSHIIIYILFVLLISPLMRTARKIKEPISEWLVFSSKPLEFEGFFQDFWTLLALLGCAVPS